MQTQPFDSMSERLLRAGVAHRHVRRYMRELRDHYDDALREELAKDLDRREAEQSAWTRLGSEDDLVRSVLSQPALRSTIARFPALSFGAAPVFLWLALLTLTAFALLGVAGAYEDATPPRWVFFGFYALWIFCVRALPVILGVVLLIASARQRLTLVWPVIGTAIVALIGGTTNVQYAIDASSGHGRLCADFTLLSMIFFPSVAAPESSNALALMMGLLRAAAMLGMAAMLYVVWRNRLNRSSMAAKSETTS